MGTFAHSGRTQVREEEGGEESIFYVLVDSVRQDVKSNLMSQTDKRMSLTDIETIASIMLVQPYRAHGILHSIS